MCNLESVSFLIPIRVDQPDRLRNLDILVSYLIKNARGCIEIIETGPQPYRDGMLARKFSSNMYTFLQEESVFFNRMKAINILAKKVKTDMIVIQDTDVLLHPEQYQDAASKIAKEGYELVYPYDGNFYDVPEKYIDAISSNNNLERNINSYLCNNMRPSGDSVGGVMYWNRAKFLECGGGNENFISWGYDDTEMYERAKKLDVKIGRCEKGLYHLHHKSSLNSLNGTHMHYKNNEQEWLKVRGMSKEQLLSYIKTWRASDV